jgi:uncharacterized membrane protein YfcA
MIATISAALASGALVGFLLGLVGGGGSILATPLLLYVVGVAQPHVAIGTGALAVSVNAFASLAGHARARNVRWRCALVFAVVGTLGAFAGSSLGKLINGNRLLFLFGLIMVAAEREANLATCLLTAAVALLAGMASGFFGVGGGFLIVPGLMLATRMPMIKAVGSSLLAVGSFGLATAINYSLSGLVDWRIAGEFIAGGTMGGLAGIMLANRLSHGKDTLKRIFAVLILVVAAYVLYRSGQTMMS